MASTGPNTQHCALAVPFKREMDQLKAAQRTRRMVRAEGEKIQVKELKNVFKILFSLRNTKERHNKDKGIVFLHRLLEGQ